MPFGTLFATFIAPDPCIAHARRDPRVPPKTHHPSSPCHPPPQAPLSRPSARRRSRADAVRPQLVPSDTAHHPNRRVPIQRHNPRWGTAVRENQAAAARHLLLRAGSACGVRSYLQRMYSSKPIPTLLNGFAGAPGPQKAAPRLPGLVCPVSQGKGRGMAASHGYGIQRETTAETATCPSSRLRPSHPVAFPSFTFSLLQPSASAGEPPVCAAPQPRRRRAPAIPLLPCHTPPRAHCSFPPGAAVPPHQAPPTRSHRLAAPTPPVAPPARNNAPRKGAPNVQERQPPLRQARQER